MHTLNRIITYITCLALGMPVLSFALVSIDERTDVQDVLQESIHSAVGSYRQTTGLEVQKDKAVQVLQEKEQLLPALQAEKREARLAVAKEKRILASIGQKYGIDVTNKETLEQIVRTEQRRISRMLKRSLFAQGGMYSGISLLYSLFQGEVHYTDALLQSVHSEFMSDLLAAQKVHGRLAEAENWYSDVHTRYVAVETEVSAARTTAEEAQDRLKRIQEIVEEVHTQVLRLQGELARIDARLKEKAQRALLEKGLITKEDLAKDDGKAFAPQFSWPVYGRVSAGFKNKQYKSYFGVDHYGQDIVVPQSTTVRAAAEGVVFLYRDGGKTGYSYILIGHRGGYATLYGHVSKSFVTSGQEVTAGQAIALSGGTPGTYGAGPMTTGAHLHFEVMRNGVNINPADILP